MSLTFPIDAKLKDGSPVQLVLADQQDIEPLRDLYRIIVEEGTSYPHDRFPDQDVFMDYWFRGKSTVAAYVPDRARAADMAGGILPQAELAGAGKTSGECRLHRRTRLAQQRLGLAAGRYDADLRQATRLPQRDLQPCVF